MRAIEVTIHNLISSGMDPKTENNAYLGFIYTSFQERATKVRMRQQQPSTVQPSMTQPSTVQPSTAQQETLGGLRAPRELSAGSLELAPAAQQRPSPVLSRQRP